MNSTATEQSTKTTRSSKEKLRTFSLKVYDPTDLTELEKFHKFCVYQGITPNELLLDMVRDYNIAYPKKLNLVTEVELFSAIKDEGLLTNKPLLLKYRKEGHLEDNQGSWYWINSSGHIVYDKDKVIAFLKHRAANPKSKLR